jgi:hypothetical protein
MTEDELGPEDLKIITLARSARARVGSAEGAAVRDETGRSYAAATVALPSLRLSALTLAVAMAVSSGASALEAAALVSDGPGPTSEDLGAMKDVGSGAVIIHARSDGTIREILRLLPPVSTAGGAGPWSGFGLLVGDNHERGCAARTGQRWR